LFLSEAIGINDNGQVVGWSCTQNFADCGGWIWQDGVMTDLTSLLPQGSPWNVIAGTSINSRGEIAVFGDLAGAFHELLLTPCNEEQVLDKGCTGKIAAESGAPQRPAAARSEVSRQLLRKRLGVRFRSVNEPTR
jgi:probable HAF family extracellular repeat protein